MSRRPGSAADVRPRSRVTRAGWFVGGWLAVAIGSVGIIVPGLPTTVFFIVAAWCFGKSSPRFEQWVLDLPRIGPMVRDHREGLGMPRRAKAWALGSMWTAIVLSSVLLRDRLVIVAIVVALGVIGTTYIVWRVPSREKVLAARVTPGVTPGARRASGLEPDHRESAWTSAEYHGAKRPSR